MVAKYLPKEQLRAKVDTYLREDEKDVIARKARAAGLPVSTYVRRAALGHKLQTVPTPNVEKWRELARLAGNLNQIAHAINGGHASGVDPLLLYEIGEQVRLLRVDLAGGAP